MTIEELPEKTNLFDIKVKLPIPTRLFANQCGDKVNEEVWLFGPFMGDWFVRNNREDKVILPLFRTSIPWDELKKWEVVEIFKS